MITVLEIEDLLTSGGFIMGSESDTYIKFFHHTYKYVLKLYRQKGQTYPMNIILEGSFKTKGLVPIDDREQFDLVSNAMIRTLHYHDYHTITFAQVGNELTLTHASEYKASQRYSYTYQMPGRVLERYRDSRGNYWHQNYGTQNIFGEPKDIIINEILSITHQELNTREEVRDNVTILPENNYNANT